MIKVLFTERLKEYFESLNISQNQFAKELGVDSATVRRRMIGKTEPTIENLWRLADYFEISVDTLIGRD